VKFEANAKVVTPAPSIASPTRNVARRPKRSANAPEGTSISSFTPQ